MISTKNFQTGIYLNLIVKQIEKNRQKRTQQRLFYVSYGMDDKKDGERKRRFYLPEKAKWNLYTRVKDAVFVEKYIKENGKTKMVGVRSIKKNLVLRQMQAALWLLCNYGAIGSKSRHGFGSLQFAIRTDSDSDQLNRNLLKTEYNEIKGLEEIYKVWEEIAKLFEIGDFQERFFHTSSFNWRDDVLQVELKTKDSWLILDEIGLVRQLFAKKHQHSKKSGVSGASGEQKVALGLPRIIDNHTNHQ